MCQLTPVRCCCCTGVASRSQGACRSGSPQRHQQRQACGGRLSAACPPARGSCLGTGADAAKAVPRVANGCLILSCGDCIHFDVTSMIAILNTTALATPSAPQPYEEASRGCKYRGPWTAAVQLSRLQVYCLRLGRGMRRRTAASLGPRAAAGSRQTTGTWPRACARRARPRRRSPPAQGGRRGQRTAQEGGGKGRLRV
jgi:hypothetical protein